MSKRWPYGTGNFEASTIVVAFVNMALMLSPYFALVVIIKSFADRGVFDDDLARAVRGWAVVAFAVVVVTWSVLSVFKPWFLRLLLPTPTPDDEVKTRLSPFGKVGRLAAPLVAILGAFVLGRGSGLLDRAAAFVCYLGILHLARPVLMSFALALRRIVLPLAPLISFAALVAAVVGLILKAPVPGLELALPELGPAWAYLAAGAGAFCLARLLRGRLEAAALGSVSREELLELAFPLQTRTARREGRMFAERFRCGGRGARIAALVQETTGYRAPEELVVGLLFWAASLGGLIYVTYERGGPAGHALVALAATGVFLGFGLLCRAGADGGPGTVALRGFALPFGAVECWLAFLAVASAAYLASGAVAAGVGHLVWPGPADVAGMSRGLRRMLSDRSAWWALTSNFAHGWFILAAVVSLPAAAGVMSPAGRGRAPGRATEALVWVGGILVLGMYLLALSAIFERDVRGSVTFAALPWMLRMVSVFVVAAARLRGFDAESLATVFARDVMADVPDGWYFDAAAWVLAAGVFALVAFSIIRRGSRSACHLFRAKPPAPARDEKVVLIGSDAFAPARK